MLRSLILSTLVAVGVACRATDNPVPSATIFFELDAPLCSSSIPVQLFIDGQVVATDTFRVHLPPDHVKSRAISTTPGTHLLGARLTGHSEPLPWADTTVSVQSGSVITRSLPFYCS